MKILYLTFYFEPDIGPGSFRNTALVNELASQLTASDSIHVITAQPNRYQSFKPTAPEYEERRNGRGQIIIERIAVPAHVSGLFDQIRAFSTYFQEAHRLAQKNEYNLIVASSSRLFTAFLGAILARRGFAQRAGGFTRHKQRVPLYLDIRDLFREAILDVLKNPLIRVVLNPMLWAVERYTFGRANHINLVSEGFRPYFKSYSQATYSYFTNGIDDVFLGAPLLSVPYTLSPYRCLLGKFRSVIRTILYAGNIGEGQGLHKIIPQAARQLGDGYRFLIFGDGGAKHKLEDSLRAENILNVEIRNPVSRTKLVAEYQKADYLFVHLNDLEACKRVLPSKLFEYGATNKPILAGVAGYAASFVREHLINSIVFNPGDIDSLVSQLRNVPYRTEGRTEFRLRFQRRTISETMARQIRQTMELD